MACLGTAHITVGCHVALLLSAHTLVTEALSTAVAVVTAITAAGTVALAGHRG